MSFLIDLSAQRFGRILVLNRAPNVNRRAHWDCICDCGKTLVIRGNSLRNGNTRSCGCLASDLLRRRSFRHGRTHSKAYSSWHHMKTRCYNSNYKWFYDYGGRGIRVCDEWLNSFQAFLQAMGDPPEGTSLDRIDVNGNYEPGNCRWSSPMEQANNKRCNAIIATAQGLFTIKEFAVAMNLKYTTVLARVTKRSKMIAGVDVQISYPRLGS